MTLKEFKDHITSFEEGTIFQFAISKPFPHRGDYDNVAFKVLRHPSTREEVLENIDMAYIKTERGHKTEGGAYTDIAGVEFEENAEFWTNGWYVTNLIEQLEQDYAYDKELKFVKLAFTKASHIHVPVTTPTLNLTLILYSSPYLEYMKETWPDDIRTHICNLIQTYTSNQVISYKENWTYKDVKDEYEDIPSLPGGIIEFHHEKALLNEDTLSLIMTGMVSDKLPFYITAGRVVDDNID
jgi:hypothetical protein